MSPVCLFLAATKQLYEWYSLSVCLSVCPSHLFDYVPIIVSSRNFQELLPMTEVMSMLKVKVRGPKVKVTEVTTQLNYFRTVTPVWIHIWWWNHAYGLVHYCFSRSFVKFQGHRALKSVELDPDWAFPDCNSSLNSPMTTKWCTKLEVA